MGAKANINALQIKDPKLAVEWRQATRRAFTEALAKGYVVEEFFRAEKSLGGYLLRR